MARIPKKAWDAYVGKLAALDDKAAGEMRTFVQRNGYGDVNSLIDYAYGLATKYGEGAAALAAEMYDSMAELEGVSVKPAEPAYTADYHTVAKTVQGVSDNSYNADMLGNSVGRLVKRAGADTMLKNAQRDGAQFAWIPHGDTCAFCLTLASRGWQYMSKNALKNGHAEHIHSNCDCTYAIRFRETDEVPGYDPEKYKEMYDNAQGRTPKEKINSMRREMYKEQKDEGKKQPTPSQLAYKSLDEAMKANKLQNLKVKKLDAPLTEDEIIARIGGGDLTKGSCSSLALTYAGNKAGYDVLDFRGGTSQAVFSRRSNITTLAQALNGTVVKAGNDFTGASTLLENVVQGKEYYLATGGHAAIVRKTSSGLEFLELQSANHNGWNPLTKDALRYRFGCKTSHSSYGQKYELTNVLIDIDNVKNSQTDFANLLGYLNTGSENQQKGTAGYAK